MVNVVALREIVPVLYRLEQQDRFRMETWADGVVNPNSSDWTDCGTQFCMAGAKAAYDGWVPQYQMDSVWVVSKETYVDIPYPTGKFFPAGTPNDEYEWADGLQEAEAIGLEGFDLSAEEGQFLFFCTHVASAAHMERRIEWLCQGHSPSSFPDEWVDEEREFADEEMYRRQSADEALRLAAASRA